MNGNTFESENAFGTIHSHAEEAKEYLKNRGFERGYLVFNGIEIPINKNSVTEDTVVIYTLLLERK